MAKLSCSKLVVACVLAFIVVALADGDASTAASPMIICKVSVSELEECLPAITGKPPPPPTKSCCGVMKKADLQCLCGYKSQFAYFGIDADNAVALPEKCGLEIPKECRKKL